jgi:hypothetical protein
LRCGKKEIAMTTPRPFSLAITTFVLFLAANRLLFAAPIDLFPTPVSSSSSAFPAFNNQVAVDDSTVQVPFTQNFIFPFYGSNYSSVFLNTNGGVTFGSGNADWNLAAGSIDQPAIAVFWGDMNAAGAPTRSGQMSYEQFADRFVVTFSQLQDQDHTAWDNSATLTLYRSGGINIAYGVVDSPDLLVGVFSGTHTSDTSVGVQSLYANYTSAGSSLVLFDEFGAGPTHSGELSGHSLYFSTTYFNDSGVPAAPTLIGITPGAGQLNIHFSAPTSSGNSQITGYTATCSASGYTTRTATGNASPLVVRNLSGNVAYLCSLTADNASGSSVASVSVVSTPRKQGIDISTILLLLLD